MAPSSSSSFRPSAVVPVLVKQQLKRHLWMVQPAAAFSIHDITKSTSNSIPGRRLRSRQRQSCYGQQHQPQSNRIRNFMTTSSFDRDLFTKRSSKSFSSSSSSKRATSSDWYSGMVDGSLSSTTTLASTLDTTTEPHQGAKDRKFVAFPFDYHETVDVRIEVLTNRGWGLGRVDVSDRERVAVESSSQYRSRRHKSRKDTNRRDDESSDMDSILEESTPKRWVIMTPNVIPGELVRVRIFRNMNNYSEGDAIEILEPKTNERMEQPKCPLSNECGGCQYQHITIDAQRKYKQLSVQESLKQFGIVDVSVSPTLGTDEIYGYRSKLTPHYQAPTKQLDGTKQIDRIGFLRQTSRSIIDVPSCIIATPEVNDKYQRVRDELLNCSSTRNLGASLLFRQANLKDGNISTHHSEYITTSVHGIQFTYQAGNFFQNNYYVVPMMVTEVVKYASLPSPSALINNDDGTTTATATNTMTHFVDCYCGSGLFALSAASKFQTVVGIEVNQKAVDEATQNAYRNNITNCQFRSASAEYIFAAIKDFPVDTTVVVLDPPRKGCSIDFLSQLIQFGPQRIVYMSCDPHTQARDAQYILQTGKYAVHHVQPFDLFPQTRHIECLIIFERRAT